MIVKAVKNPKTKIVTPIKRLNKIRKRLSSFVRFEVDKNTDLMILLKIQKNNKTTIPAAIKGSFSTIDTKRLFTELYATFGTSEAFLSISPDVFEFEFCKNITLYVISQEIIAIIKTSILSSQAEKSKNAILSARQLDF